MGYHLEVVGRGPVSSQRCKIRLLRGSLRRRRRHWVPVLALIHVDDGSGFWSLTIQRNILTAKSGKDVSWYR